jgi:hypothetical protein
VRVPALPYLQLDIQEKLSITKVGQKLLTSSAILSNATSSVSILMMISFSKDSRQLRTASKAMGLLFNQKALPLLRGYFVPADRKILLKEKGNN